jgi:hypothetical protein
MMSGLIIQMYYDILPWGVNEDLAYLVYDMFEAYISPVAKEPTSEETGITTSYHITTYSCCKYLTSILFHSIPFHCVQHPLGNPKTNAPSPTAMLLLITTCPNAYSVYPKRRRKKEPAQPGINISICKTVDVRRIVAS